MRIWLSILLISIISISAQIEPGSTYVFDVYVSNQFELNGRSYSNSFAQLDTRINVKVIERSKDEYKILESSESDEEISISGTNAWENILNNILTEINFIEKETQVYLDEGVEKFKFEQQDLLQSDETTINPLGYFASTNKDFYNSWNNRDDSNFVVTYYDDIFTLELANRTKIIGLQDGQQWTYEFNIDLKVQIDTNLGIVNLFRYRLELNQIYGEQNLYRLQNYDLTRVIENSVSSSEHIDWSQYIFIILTVVLLSLKIVKKFLKKNG